MVLLVAVAAQTAGKTGNLDSIKRLFSRKSKA
jgi:hypothetical protein